MRLVVNESFASGDCSQCLKEGVKAPQGTVCVYTLFGSICMTTSNSICIKFLLKFYLSIARVGLHYVTMCKIWTNLKN